MARSYHSISKLATELKVTRVARVTGLDRTGVEVACAVRPDGQILQVCNGKGWSWEQACASAVFESAELYAAEQGVREWRLARDEASADGWSSEQLGGADGGEIATVLAQRLDQRGQVRVPAHAVVCSRHVPGPVTVSWSSNGMGAGFTHRRALAHALDEVWERHALALMLPDGWLPERVATRRLEVGSPFEGFEVAVFDLSLDEGPWVVGALLFDLEEGPIPLAAGYAARARLAHAIDAALLEAAQSRLTEIHAAREDVVTRPGPREVSAFRDEIRRLRPMRRQALPRATPWWKHHPAAYVPLGHLPGLHVVKVLAPGLEVSELL